MATDFKSKIRKGIENDIVGTQELADVLAGKKPFPVATKAEKKAAQTSSAPNKNLDEFLKFVEKNWEKSPLIKVKLTKRL